MIAAVWRFFLNFLFYKKCTKTTKNHQQNFCFFFKSFICIQDCAEEIRNPPRKSFSDLTSFFFFEILTKNSVWKCAFSTYVYISSWNWFSLKNNGKNEQLLLKTFFSKSIFRDFLLVKLGSFTTRALLKNRLTKKMSLLKVVRFFQLLLTKIFSGPYT